WAAGHEVLREGGAERDQHPQPVRRGGTGHPGRPERRPADGGGALMFRRGEGEERHEQGPIQPTEVRMKEQGSGGPEVTVVGKGARIEGNLISAGSLRIDGQVKGKVTAEGDVTLSPQSEVDAEIKATNVTVGGNFKGNIVAGNNAELARGGRVEGNVTSKGRVVAEGA